MNPTAPFFVDVAIYVWALFWVCGQGAGTAEKLGEAWTDFAAEDENWSTLAASNTAFSNISESAGDWLNQ